jgi:spore coat protein U-like protein
VSRVDRRRTAVEVVVPTPTRARPVGEKSRRNELTSDSGAFLATVVGATEETPATSGKTRGPAGGDGSKGGTPRSKSTSCAFERTQDSDMEFSRIVPRVRRPLLGASLAVASMQAADAATATATFQVTANVATQCTVSAADLGFGTVDPLGGNVDQTTTVTVRCTKNTAYTVGLNAGTTAGATLAQRLMANGGDTMNYNLYTDAGRTAVWGNSAAAPTWVAGTGAGMGTPQVLTVYGRVPSGQTNLAVGSFVETAITVTVTY